jgi:predicted oxidoreductase
MISQVHIPNTDLSMSRIIPGLMRLLEWNLTPAALVDWIQACLDLGMTTFDHADIYGDHRCEAAFGAALALEPDLRARMQIVTKCDIKFPSERRPGVYIPHYDTTRDHIIASAENSLRNFNTDYLDVLLIHRPDPLMNPDEIAEAFGALRQAGKVRYFGVSNFTPSQFTMLASRWGEPLVTNQIEFSVVQLDPLYDGTLDLCQRERVTAMAWSPLAGGRLFAENGDERSRRVRAALEQVAEAIGAQAVDQVVVAWLLTHPAMVLPVLGTGNLDRLRLSAEAEALTLDRQQWFTILKASHGHDVP